MELADDLVLTRLRCSPFHGSLDADPVGSAGSYDAFLCIEVPPPWERDISGNEPFRSLGKDLPSGDGRRWRAQGLVPGEDGGGLVRVLAFERPDTAPARRRFERREWLVEPEQVVALARALLAGGASSIVEFDDLEVDTRPGVIDLMVCTHGKRDSCCGGIGTAMHQELTARLADRSDAEELVRMWRCSHTGGHRFAPTALTFPDGYAWAHLTAELTERLIRREGSPADFASHCRGSSLFDGAPAQAADRAALIHFGWDWLDAVRRPVVIAHERDTLATTIRIEGRIPAQENRPVGLVVRVEVDRYVPQPTCGAVDRPEFGVEPVWTTTSVSEVTGQ